MDFAITKTAQVDFIDLNSAVFLLVQTEPPLPMDLVLDLQQQPVQLEAISQYLEDVLHVKFLVLVASELQTLVHLVSLEL